MHRIVVAAVVAVLAGPSVVVVVLTLFVSSIVGAACSTATPVTVGPIPEQLQATAADGSPVRLDRTQLGHAATIMAVGSRITGVGHEGLLAALMAGLTESGLRMYANTTAYPTSANFPHDGDGADNDSLGIFQMRPAAGWGSVTDLMDPTYQARAFFGGPDGPNGGSPRGLLDVSSWRELPAGAAAQAVEVSAYPDRYARYEPVAAAILAALTTPVTPDTAVPAPVAGSARVFPLPGDTWSPTSRYGMRLNPVTHRWALHAGADLAAPAGTPVLATADGRVVAAGPGGGLGNHITLAHGSGTGAAAGDTVASVYGHLLDGGIHVAVGDLVTAGQHIGDVGSTGVSSGPHLHFELRPGGGDRPAIDPQPWLDGAGHLGAGELITAAAPTSSCPANAANSGVNP